MNAAPPATSKRPAEIRVLGYRVHPMTGAEVIEQVALAISERRRLVMANLNLHAMAMMFQSPGMARLLNQADTQVMIDGMPIVVAANIAGHGLPKTKRLTSLDFYDDMFTLGVKRGWRIGYVGATPDVLARGLAELRRRFPAMDVDGRDGFFDIAEDGPGTRQAAILDWLRERSHDLVIVGMGMPRQEEWIERVQHRIPSRVLMPTGAYLDYQVGVQKLPPRWLAKNGFEGVVRLVQNPRRLGYRYLVEPLVLAGRLATRRHPQRSDGAPPPGGVP